MAEVDLRSMEDSVHIVEDPRVAQIAGYQPYGSTPESYGTLKKGTPDYTVPAATPEGGGESEPQETRSEEGETLHTKQQPPVRLPANR